MFVQCSGEDGHEGGEEGETALSSLRRLISHLLVEGPYDARDLGVEEREGAGGEERER